MLIVVLVGLILWIITQTREERRLHAAKHYSDRAKEAWKTYALTLEVANECIQDYYETIDGEGCGTKSKRLAKVREQWHNAAVASYAALDELEQIGEYAGK